MMAAGDGSQPHDTAAESPYVGQVRVADRSRLSIAVGSALKRVIDLVGASLLVVALSPLMLAVALAIKLDSRGPVLFHQDRVGSKRISKDGVIEWKQTTFRVHKFRSMYHEADQSLHREYIKSFVEGTVEESDAARSNYKLTGDPRVTRIGGLLRRTSIDELPQLFNVIAGEMSLVGPRPVPLYEVAEYEPWQMERLHALPGITGYWQVHGRGVVTFEEMMRMDIFYVRSRSLWLDLKLLAMTLPAVVSGKGAE